jgi:hypothetical protein
LRSIYRDYWLNITVVATLVFSIAWSAFVEIPEAMEEESWRPGWMDPAEIEAYPMYFPVTGTVGVLWCYLTFVAVAMLFSILSLVLSLSFYVQLGWFTDRKMSCGS